MDSLNPEAVPLAHCAMTAELIVGVNHLIEALDVTGPSLMLPQPKPRCFEANVFFKAGPQLIDVWLFRWRNISVQCVQPIDRGRHYR
jgi:hypothetical protein